MAFAIGENVGAYRIVAQLGQGGMASVFKAYHAALDRYVALKVLHPAFMEDPNFLARFQREARVIARLEHQNIVPIYDFAQHAGQPFLGMKFIAGETLKARLARGALDGSQVLAIVDAVGQALSYAHRQGILHRDIKPSNVLLGEDGSIYLADFGLARIAQAGESTISSDMLLGTPQYISPEQARGERDLDAGTDIYSLGVVVYELLVGRVPFSADTPFSIIHDHIYTPLPLPRAINPNVSERLERVLLKALAKERADRFRTIEEMVSSFLSASQGIQELPIGEGRAESVKTLQESGKRERPERRQRISPESAADGPVAGLTASAAQEPRKRRRWWLAGAGLVVGCLCLFGIVAIGGQLQEPSNQTAAVDTERPVAPPIVAARATVNANPADADSQLMLAQTLFQEEMPRLALEAAIRAGELYLEQDRPVAAAEALSQVLRASGGPRRADRRLINLAIQALFMSSAYPERAFPVIEPLYEEYPDWQVFQPIAARLFFHSGETEEALSIVETRLSNAPDDALTQAVYAEFLFEAGELEEARVLAEAALKNPKSPAWLADHLRNLLNLIDEA